MKISIITPTNNSENNIDKCVQSIISQTYKNFEHIVVDNLSTDRTVEIVKNIYLENDLSSKLRIISEKDGGISDAFNKGIEATTGDIITILNSDDYYFSQNVFEEVDKAFNNPKIMFVHGNILFKDDLYGSNIRKPLLCDVRKAMPFNHLTMFLRKELYKQIGLFDIKYKYAMDFDLICRLHKSINNLKFISVHLDSEPMVVMKAGGASWSNELKSIEETKKSLKEHGYWNYPAKKNYLFRILRTRMKKYMNIFKLNFLVKYWRSKKWKN